MGEGLIIGMIDTGINGDHPSFADPGPADGYDYTNPLGTYVGDCAAADPHLYLQRQADRRLRLYHQRRPGGL